MADVHDRQCAMPRSLMARIAVAERVVGAVAEQRRQRAAGHDAEAERLQAAWDVMRPTMSDEHARIVVEAYASGFHLFGSPGAHTPAGRLLRRCLDAMRPYTHWPYDAIPPAVALAMPPAVAQVYLDHADAQPYHDCEGCGYNLSIRYFQTCPLCGGTVGWYAYFNRRSSEDRR